MKGVVVMLESLKKRMEFLKDFGYDKHFYACFTSSKDINVVYELYLNKDKKWILRQGNSDVPLNKYPGMTSEQVIQNLGCLGINEEEVYFAISSQCFEQVFYARMIIDKANELLGRDEVESAIKGQEEFIEKLTEVVTKLTGGTKEVIKGEGKTTPKKNGHLKVVK